VHAPDEEAPWQPGAASRWWQHHALAALGNELSSLGSRLLIRRGATREVLARLVAESGAGALYWNRLYEPASVARDTAIKTWGRTQGLETHSHNGSLLHEPWELETRQGKPYRVFTPFHRACQACGEPTAPLPAPSRLPAVDDALDSEPLENLGLLPRHRWGDGLAAAWQAGTAAARRQLDGFVIGAVAHYQGHRDLPAVAGTSRLSPYLHHGELSPRQVYWACHPRGEAAAAYLRQLHWREFAHHLLYHFPHTPERALDARFAELPWRTDAPDDLAAWQAGRSGIPIVDAGMRELWQTGWMHNRVRMLVASLLSKNLLIPWQLGARWFWDTLVDADLANNTLGWQWTAGCGADAAPYFRIFNPVLQGERFDRRGDYLRRWLPELAGLPDKWLHKPWQAPQAVLSAAGIDAEQPWRDPIVDLAGSRWRALTAWGALKHRAR